jgi:CRP-like cAMP-binding protein
VSCARCPISHAAHSKCPFRPKQRERGEVLCTEGSPADRVWLLKQGVVVLSRASHGGAAVAWTVRRPASFVGLEALIGPSYRDTAICATSAVVCSVSRQAMDALLAVEARPVLEQVIAVCVDDARVWTGSAAARVAGWLLDTESSGLADSLPRHVIAELLDMQPETLSRVLVQLAQAGAIEPSRREIKIIDRDRLRQLAE